MANVSVQSARNNGLDSQRSATNVIFNWPERIKTQPHDDRDNCFLPFDSKGPCGMTAFNDIDDDSATKHSDSHIVPQGTPHPTAERHRPWQSEREATFEPYRPPTDRRNYADTRVGGEEVRISSSGSAGDPLDLLDASPSLQWTCALPLSPLSNGGCSPAPTAM